MQKTSNSDSNQPTLKKQSSRSPTGVFNGKLLLPSTTLLPNYKKKTRNEDESGVGGAKLGRRKSSPGLRSKRNGSCRDVRMEEQKCVKACLKRCRSLSQQWNLSTSMSLLDKLDSVADPNDLDQQPQLNQRLELLFEQYLKIEQGEARSTAEQVASGGMKDAGSMCDIVSKETKSSRVARKSGNLLKVEKKNIRSAVSTENKFVQTVRVKCPILASTTNNQNLPQQIVGPLLGATVANKDIGTDKSKEIVGPLLGAIVADEDIAHRDFRSHRLECSTENSSLIERDQVSKTQINESELNLNQLKIKLIENLNSNIAGNLVGRNKNELFSNKIPKYIFYDNMVDNDRISKENINDCYEEANSKSLLNHTNITTSAKPNYVNSEILKNSNSTDGALTSSNATQNLSQTCKNNKEAASKDSKRFKNEQFEDYRKRIRTKIPQPI